MKTSEEIRHLIAVATEMLRSMLLPSSLFCYDRIRNHLSCRGISIRYSLITLLGLIKAEKNHYDIRLNIGDIYKATLAGADSPVLTPGDFGLYLWVDSELGSKNYTTLFEKLKSSLESVGGYKSCTGMEMAWIIIGTTRIAQETGSVTVKAVLNDALSCLYNHYISPSELFYHYGKPNLRRRFPNFATQIYSIKALCHYAAFDNDGEAIRVAKSAADKLLALQLSDGGWPWLYDAVNGRVVERYEIYSVHQDAMAPMSLFKLSQLCGDKKYALAAFKGLDWLYGMNELRYNMIDEEEGLIYRSIRRRRPYNKLMLLGNTLIAGLKLGNDFLPGRFLEINPTCRSYHLGWILYAWCGNEVLGEQLIA